MYSFFSEHNMAFFMDLVFDKGVSQGDIIDILKKCEVEVKISSYRIVAESIHFRGTYCLIDILTIRETI